MSATNRISAERLEFNTRTKTGTFYNASGIANLENRGIERSLFGSQEPDAYFYGETIEKLGPKTYRITKGGFTTCVQPTPRWEMVASSVTLTLEKRAVLTNMVLKVKDVPVFYLPAMYYPINKSDRATGFLLPIYGQSTIKGHTLNNAFFWAINRSQDATLYHSFYSKTGQGFGGDYRYVQSGGSSGSFQTSFLREHEADLRAGGRHDPDGARAAELPGHRRPGPAAAGQPPAVGERQLLLEPDLAAALPAERLRGDQPLEDLRRQYQRQLGRALDQRHHRPKRGLHERHRLERARVPSQGRLQPRGEAHRQAAALFRRQHRIRDAHPDRQDRRPRSTSAASRASTSSPRCGSRSPSCPS